MQGGLEFYTTQELIDELMRRQTFLGVVVHSAEECRGGWSGERVFKVHFNANLDAGQTGRLLDSIAAHIEQRAE